MTESSSKMSGMLNAKFGAVTVSSGPTRAAVVCTRGRRTKTRRGMISTARPGVAKGKKQTCPEKKNMFLWLSREPVFPSKLSD